MLFFLKKKNLRIWVLRLHLKMFAEDTLWTGTPGNYTNPKAPEALSKVRKLVDGGKYAEATAVGVELSDGPSDVCYSVFHKAFLLHNECTHLTYLYWFYLKLWKIANMSLTGFSLEQFT